MLETDRKERRSYIPRRRNSLSQQRRISLQKGGNKPDGGPDGKPDGASDGPTDGNPVGGP